MPDYTLGYNDYQAAPGVSYLNDMIGRLLQVAAWKRAQSQALGLSPGHGIRDLGQYEAARSREAQALRSELEPVLRYGSPENEDFQKALDQVEEAKFDYRERRPLLGLLAGTDKFREVSAPLFTVDEQRALIDASLEGQKGDYLQRVALQRARDLQQVPIDVAEERFPEGLPVTTWDVSKGPAFDLARVPQPKTTGGKAAEKVWDPTAGYKRVEDLYIYDYTNDGERVPRQVSSSDVVNKEYIDLAYGLLVAPKTGEGVDKKTMEGVQRLQSLVGEMDTNGEIISDQDIQPAIDALLGERESIYFTFRKEAPELEIPAVEAAKTQGKKGTGQVKEPSSYFNW